MDVEVAVSLEVGQDDAEAVAEAHDLEPGLPPHLEFAVARVQEQEVPPTRVGVREALRRLRNARGLVDVAMDDEVGPPVAVDARQRRPCASRRPGVGGALFRFGELLAVVPEQRAAIGARDVQVGVAVVIEVGSDAALAPEGDAGFPSPRSRP